MKQNLAPVKSNSEVMPGVYLMWLESPEIASTAMPGQFVMVQCGDETLLRRPLSIHKVDDKKTGLALLFTVAGKGTHWLSQCKTDDYVDLLGPLGNGFYVNLNSQNLLLVAGGIGTAPLGFLAQKAAGKGYSLRLLYGAATASQLYPMQSLSPEIEMVTATEDGTAGRKGMITDLLPDYLDWADQVFACGPLPMYKTMAQIPELRNKSVQVSLEMRMGCGLGFCYGCTVKTKSGLKQVCKDGPVFDLKDVLWEEIKRI